MFNFYVFTLALFIPIIGSIFPPLGIFLLLIVIFKYNFRFSSPILFCFLLFIIFDLLSLLLLNAGISHYFFLFQGFVLLFLIIEGFRIKLFFKVRYIILGSYLLLTLILGILNGGSIVVGISLIKSVILLSLILELSLFYKERFTIIHFTALFFVVSISSVIHIYQMIVGFDFYFDSLNIDLFYNERGITTGSELPIGFVAHDPISNEFINRFTGIFLSPDKFAYVVLVMVSAFYYSLLSRVSSNLLFMAVIFFIAVFIMWGFHVKAPILIFVVSAFNFYLWRSGLIKTFSKRVIVTGFVTILVAILVLTLVPRGYLSSSGAIQHTLGLITPFLNTNVLSFEFIFGHGAGTGGAMGGGGELKKADVGGESFIGALFYQTGVLGLFMLFGFYNYLDQVILKKLVPEVYGVASSLIIGTLCASFVSEGVFSFFQIISILFTILALSSLMPKEASKFISSKNQ